MGRSRIGVVVAAACVALVGCGGGGTPDEQTPQSPTPATDSPAPDQSPTETGSPTPSETATSTPTRKPDLSPRVVATDLQVPWGIDFLPDGTALVAERTTGDVQHVAADGSYQQVGSVPGVAFTSEGGLLGLAVSPDFADNRFVYLYLTTDSDNRVVRMRFRDDRLSQPTTILDGIPAGAIHDGGRIAFGPDNMLYVTTGEAGDEQLAQDPDSLGGKILRIRPNGDIPADNPDPDSPVWTMGHRNVQGLAWDDQGRLWATEFGASTWDELNLIEPGNNYGWPAAEGKSDLAGMTDPVVQWSTDEASPSGVAFLRGSLWIASLNGERLWQVPVREDGSVGEPKAHYVDRFGRLRTVVVTPDQRLWFTTSNRDGRGQPAPQDDRILEIDP